MNKQLMSQIIDQRRLLNRIIRERAMDPWTTLNLTVPQLRSLFYVSRNGKVNLSGLASGIKVTPANVTGIVDRLVKNDMLIRSTDPNDRRVLWIKLTDRAKSLIDELREGRSREMRNILQNLTDEELSMVSHGYSLLIKAAKVSSLHGSDGERVRFSDASVDGDDYETESERTLPTFRHEYSI
jgi:DNA-binding MarR family transcriptional regulator